MGKIGKKEVYYLSCERCGRDVEVETENVTRVLCWECTTQLGAASATPTAVKIKSEHSVENGFPKGWHFMKRFVHADGRVFEKGEENVELKGKYKPTPVSKKVLETPLLRSQRRRIREEKELRKQAKLAQVYKLKRRKKKDDA